MIQTTLIPHMIYSRVLILERKLLTATDDFSGRVMSESKPERRSFGVFHCHSRNVPATPDGPTMTTLSNLWDDYSYPSLKRPAVLTSLFSHTLQHMHINTHGSSLHPKKLCKRLHFSSDWMSSAARFSPFHQ